jgi:soluble lytic murein transglycosylase-like protein
MLTFSVTPAGVELPTKPRRSGRPLGSIDQYIQHYLQKDVSEPAGEHTIMIRKAFAHVQSKQRRRFGWVIGAVLGLVLGLSAYTVHQQRQIRRQQQAASGVFTEMKTMDLQIAQMKAVVEATGNAELSEQLQRLEESRERMRQRYDGYVQELGVYRKLDEEEKVIYRVARVFNESEFGMPAAFVDSVRHAIKSYWQTPAGRDRFLKAVRLAEREGYTPYVVKVMRNYGLPPQLFYLALQESDLNLNAIGPSTRWGRAKGMWQLISPTATRFGLDPGAYPNENIVDPLDERHDFRKSTDAAAKYLHAIYSTMAQASGLLVVASYNWGEHRIINRLERLTGPQTIPEEALEGIPEDPGARNYWRFLGEYRDRMPQETKEYVLRIFSAAVIGENPRRFGFEVDNPLKAYMERSP